MPHIDLKNTLPGILSLFEYNPETSPALNNLAQVLLRGPSSLKEYERELIASYVSHLNNCNFCFQSHAAATDALFGDTRLTSDPENLLHMDELSVKMKTLLVIASRVQRSGLAVTDYEINQAKQAGATDKEIHDTVLISAAFCMYNRYVDGLKTISSTNKEDYKEIGKSLAETGYHYTSVVV